MGEVTSTDTMPLEPHLVQSSYGGHTLMVNKRPFLIRGAELQNSSISCPEYMRDVYQDLKNSHINTILAPVTWEAIEPQESCFDFTRLDSVIQDARSHGLHLILLWFGAFKNAKSTYTPPWVKMDPLRFPRAELRTKIGSTNVTDAISIFSPDIAAADASAFKTLMRHLRQTDKEHSTVIMVQVENEVGLLGDSRDASSRANVKFNAPVPQQVLNLLYKENDTLHPRLRRKLKNCISPCSAVAPLSWPEMFGCNAFADSMFMAYHFASYVQQVTEAGKVEYGLPMYSNVWQNYADEDADLSIPVVAGGGGEPGDYPSGGAVIDVLDIWQRFAPSLDLIAPDLYLNDYNAVCANYLHRGQPLMIPEQRRDEYGARRIWSAYGTFGALCTAPFGIDTLPLAESPWPKHYRILSDASEHVLTAQEQPGSSFGFFFDELGTSQQHPTVWRKKLGDWDLSIERAFVFGKPGPGFGMVIQLAATHFMLLGEGYQVRFASTKDGSRFTGILSFVEKVKKPGSGQLIDGRTLNGDETRSGEVAIMPNENPDYGDFPISITVPARTGIAVCEVYALF